MKNRHPRKSAGVGAAIIRDATNLPFAVKQVNQPPKPLPYTRCKAKGGCRYLVAGDFCSQHKPLPAPKVNAIG